MRAMLRMHGERRKKGKEITGRGGRLRCKSCNVAVRACVRIGDMPYTAGLSENEIL